MSLILQWLENEIPMNDIDKQIKQLQILHTSVPSYKQSRIRAAIGSLKDAKRHLDKAKRLTAANLG